MKILTRDREADEKAEPKVDPDLVSDSYCPIRSTRGFVPMGNKLTGEVAPVALESPTPCTRRCMMHVKVPGDDRGRCGLTLVGQAVAVLGSVAQASSGLVGP